MSPLILRTATRYMVPLLLLFSVFLVWRGHHEPGGGFVGGLVAATAFVLVALSEGPAVARRLLRVSPARLIPLGLAISLGSGLVSVFLGQPMLTGLWWEGAGTQKPSLGTPLLFDVGVYVTVAAVILAILFELMEEPA